MSREAMIAPISDWLLDCSLGDNDIVELFQAMCRKLVGVGIPVKRARLFWPTLHPLFQAETVLWDLGEPARLEQFEHQDNASDAWNKSPLKYLLDNQLDLLRRQLSGPNALIDFDLMHELKEQGYTDFFLLGTKLQGTSFRVREENGNQGILVSWASNREGGFSSDDLWALQRIQKRFAVACKTVIQSRISGNVARTYLGDRAGSSVLNGQIRRGDGAKTSAVVWYSDLRNSTSLAETMEAEEYFGLLNSYFMATAEPVVANGGEILDFIGDAVLGIFPYEEPSQIQQAADAANQAVLQALSIAEEKNRKRINAGMEKFNFGIGLNVGEVRFGNIGIPSRLAFSVIGPTVNQVARIEGMTKLLQHTVLADHRFAQLAPGFWQPAGEHKLDGVLDPVKLYSFNNTADTNPEPGK